MSKEPFFFVIAHNIRSLYNVGSIFRTADAFGVRKIFLTGFTGSPKNPIHGKKISKVALGAENYVPWDYQKSVVTVLKKLKKEKCKIVALENNLPKKFEKKIKKMNEKKSKQSVVLLLGEERQGIKPELLKFADEFLEIPMLGEKESLNVSVAFGVAAYILSQKVLK